MTPDPSLEPTQRTLTAIKIGHTVVWVFFVACIHPEGAGRVLVDVHQVVRDLSGAVLGDEHVGHRFTIEDGLIQRMEVCPREHTTGR